MAAASAVSMALSLSSATQRSVPGASFGPLSLKPRAKTHAVSRANARRLVVKATSMKEKAVAGIAAAALTASLLIPDVAEAAELSPSLKNFLLSIVAGGVVLTVIIGAIVAVSNFDPVKRG